MTNRKNNPWLYFLLTYTWSWLFGFWAVLTEKPFDQPPVPILRILHGIGPLLVAMGFLYLNQSPEKQRDYWKRVIDVKRIRPRWWLVILLTVPAVTGIAAFGDILFGGIGARFQPGFQPTLVGTLSYTVFILFFGPLPEELGWRGFALDELQKSYDARTSSLILGIGWASWHLPLFFVPGTYQNQLGVGTLAFWIYLIAMVFSTFVMTWIYNHTQRSTLSAILFHFMINFTGELFTLSPRAEILQFIVWGLVAITIALSWTKGEACPRSMEEK